MADTKLSALGARNSLSGTDLVYLVSGGVSYSATVDVVVSYARTNMYPQVATYADLPVSTGSGNINIVQGSTGIWPIRKYAGFWRDTGGGWVWLGNSTWVGDEIGFTPAGNIAATNVSDALKELDTEKAIAGLATASGLTVGTSKLLGRTTAATGAVEELAVAGGLSLGSGALTGAVNHPGYVAGNWYCPVFGASTQAGGVIAAAGSIRLLPFTLSKPITVSDLGARVTTTNAGNFQLALYANNAATAHPTGTALCSTGNISCASAVSISLTVGGNVTLAPGTYWMAVNQDNTAAAYTTVVTAASYSAYLVGSATLANMSVGVSQFGPALQVAQTFGTWPDLTSASFTEIITAQNAIVFLKAA